ncbi:MAG TPA: hypothetical protein VNZ57_04105 [Longimicrobiales bacterium]|nr:hypothetical protein [Longimicrobiales bacterium]
MRAISFGIVAVVVAGLVSMPSAAASQPLGDTPSALDTWMEDVALSAVERDTPPSADVVVRETAAARLADDHAAIQAFRPGYSFWHSVFTIPDGSVVFAEAATGRVLATLPNNGNWRRDGEWADPELGTIISNVSLPSNLTQRRARVAEILESVAGPVVHNATRGNFVLPNAKRYGSFLEEWGAIYERFGVPADIGLAQALIESGLSGTVRSEARALGFCQWLPANWERLKRDSPIVIEGYNQTTQAQYCAAYLTVLATKYGSFIPALSEHHAGAANVGRVITSGERLGATESRERYLVGADFVRDLRDFSPRTFQDVYGTYGPRSYLYSEMVFGTMQTVQHFRETIPQERIYAMRTTRAIPIGEVTRRTGLSADEVRRYNPALIREVPRGATLYLPTQIDDFGADVAFWHRPPDPAFSQVMAEFVTLRAAPEEWYEPEFEAVLRDFQRRFRETGTEEGHVMATILAFTVRDLALTRPLLAQYRSSTRIRNLIDQGMRQRAQVLANRTMAE